MKKKDGGDIESIIWKAVEAMKVASERTTKDAYHATERRLHALPDIRAKLEDDREALTDVRQHGVQNKSRSVTRFLKSSVRLTPEEVLAAVRQLPPTNMKRALASIADDEYYATVTGKYIDRLTDVQIAEKIRCDASTVWRNRKRLVQRLSVRLYGAEAIR